MVLVTIAQATMSNWTPPDPSDKAASSEGVYFELLPEPNKGCICLGCSFRNACHCMSKQHAPRNIARRTATADEQRTMVWRQYNQDNFLIPLITLGGQGWSNRKGETTKIFAKVYRKSISEDDEDELLCTLVGSFKVGVWGPVILRLPERKDDPIEPAALAKMAEPNEGSQSMTCPSPANSWAVSSLITTSLFTAPQEGDERSDSDDLSTQPSVQSQDEVASAQVSCESMPESSKHPQLVIELQPMSSRPLSLELSRPRDKSETLDSLASKIGFVKVQSLRARSPSIVRASIASGSQPMEAFMQYLERNKNERQQPRVSTDSAGGAKSTMEGSIQRCSSMGSHESFVSSSASSGMLRILSGGGRSWSSASQPLSCPEPVKSRFNKNPDRGHKRIANFLNRKQDQDAYVGCHDWKPKVWNTDVWIDFWPIDREDLGHRYEIVPLMEAEFRRDSVVLFNTMFPLVHGEMFTLFKDFALDPQSKLQFRCASRYNGARHSMQQAPAGFGLLPESPQRQMTLSSLEHVPSQDSDGLRQFSDRRSFDYRSSLQSKLQLGLTWSKGSGILQTASSVFRRSDSATKKADKQEEKPLLVEPKQLQTEDCNRSLEDDATDSTNEFDINVLGGSSRSSPIWSKSVSTGIYSTKLHLGTAGYTTSCIRREDSDESYNDAIVPDDAFSNWGSRGQVYSLVKHKSAVQYREAPSMIPSSGTASPTPTDDQDKESYDENIPGEDEDAIAWYNKMSVFASHPSRHKASKFIVNIDSPNFARMATISREIERVGSSYSTGPPEDGLATASTENWEKASSSKLSLCSHDRTSGRSAKNLDEEDKSPPRVSHAYAGCKVLTTPRGSFFDEHSPRIMLMKRLFICFAVCGVYYTEVANSNHIGDLWPYPLAAVLGHGSRVLIRLEDVDASEFMNFLMFGDPQIVSWKDSGVPFPLKPRIAATHSVQLDMETGHLVEKTLRTGNAMETMQNISDGYRKKHLGLDLPIGGVGNESAMGSGCFVNFAGKLARQSKGAGKRSIDKALTKFQTLNSIQSSTIKHKTSQSSIGSDGIDCEMIPDRAHCAGSDDHGWNLIPKVQNGHMYIRIDDFGQQRSQWNNIQETSESLERKRVMNRLQKKISKDEVEQEQAKMRLKVFRHTSNAGELFFTKKVPILRTSREAQQQYDTKGHDIGSGTSLRLVRVSSAPSIASASTDAYSTDVKWVHKMVAQTKDAPMTLPPSPAALQLLLQHYDPINSQLFGTGGFKSIQDFYEELLQEKSSLIKKEGDVWRMLEPVILRLSWKDHILVLRYELSEDKDYPVQKNTCVGARAIKDESWREALQRTIENELNLPADKFMNSLEPSSVEDAKCHKVITETTMSPSYPIRTYYQTHHVRWTIRAQCVDLYKEHGLPVDLEKRNENAYKCDFVTTKISNRGSKKLFWNWMPESEANKLQRFLNMGEENADERWAKYAFQKEGMVAPPPSENALKLLLTRCGIAVSNLGRGTNKPLNQFWLELVNQDSNLQMSYGSILRVVDVVLIKLKIFTASGQSLVLVQTRHVMPDGQTKVGKKPPGTRKQKQETWQESAFRCMVEDLALSRSQVKSLLAQRNTDNVYYMFTEEQTESASYPGVQTLFRKHFVSYTLKLDVASTPAGRAILGLDTEDVIFGHTMSSSSLPVRRSRSKGGADRSSSVSLRRSLSFMTGGYGEDYPVRARSREEIDLMEEPSVIEPGRKYIARSKTPAGSKVIEYTWLDEAETQQEVRDFEFWNQAKLRTEQHYLSSVLLGLEGSSPQSTSAFGNEHGSIAAVNKVSATGNRKWKTYRLNNALQIPASTGGMRVKINRKMFQEFMETCNALHLLDISADLMHAPDEGCCRELLNHRFLEKELFKQVLGGSATAARRAVDWMKEYRRDNNMISAAYAS